MLFSCRVDPVDRVGQGGEIEEHPPKQQVELDFGASVTARDPSGNSVSPVTTSVEIARTESTVATDSRSTSSDAILSCDSMATGISPEVLVESPHAAHARAKASSDIFATDRGNARLIVDFGVRNGRMHPELEEYIRRVLLHADGIPAARRLALEEVAGFVSAKLVAGQEAQLSFICTHNSRRSQMAELWAAAAAAHFGIDGVRTCSGGTEATAFNPRAVAAIERAGFRVENPGGENPHYRVTYSDAGPVLECFSKTYDDPFNPGDLFAAIMTCADADEACPVVLGASIRAPIRYEDPKVADGTPSEASAYDARCRQIASEMLYLFSRV